jgi:hypothetical protein
METSLAEKRWPVRRTNQVKMQVYRIDSNGQPVIGESEQLCRKTPGERRISDALSHSKGIWRKKTEMFSLSSYRDIDHLYVSPLQPHIAADTMARTGTRQPPSCGKRPNAVGQSIMLLPENSLRFAIHNNVYSWLVRAAINCNEGRATVVVRDGNTDHMAKGCRLGWLLKLPALEITPCH